MLQRTPETWTRLAESVRTAGALVEANPGDEALSAQYRAEIDAMFSSEWEETLENLRTEPSTALAEPCIDFLEADPVCFRSGYEKEKVCRILTRVQLGEEQRRRLGAVVERVLAGPPRVGREMKRWQQLFQALNEESN